MRNFPALFSLIFSVLLLGACQSGPDENQDKNQKEAILDAAGVIAETEGPLTVVPLLNSQAYPDAVLSLDNQEYNADGTFSMDFSVNNYELGVQTPGAEEHGLANSGKGQHIHVIVDNAPYEAHYSPEVTTDKLKEPGNHVVLAFLSRSYHESVKNMTGEQTSYVLFQTTTGEGDYEVLDLDAPRMFYSRPKGTYTGKANYGKLLLDFFLVNCDLGQDAYQIGANINGQEFTITKWQPYVIEGLEPGEVTIKLDLMDAGGNPVPGKFNSVTRTVTLEPDPAP